MRRRRSVKTCTRGLIQARWWGGATWTRYFCLSLIHWHLETMDSAIFFMNELEHKPDVRGSERGVNGTSAPVCTYYSKSMCVCVCCVCVCVLTPWFSHPVSLWHWDRRRAAWQRWLSAWSGLSAGRTFPVLCGAGIHTSVAIPAREEGGEGERLHPSPHGAGFVLGTTCNLLILQ